MSAIERSFPRCIFDADTIEIAFDELAQRIGRTPNLGNCSVEFENETRTFGSVAEWLVAYRRPNQGGFLTCSWDASAASWALHVNVSNRAALRSTKVTAKAPSEAEAERLRVPFERARGSAYVAPPASEPPAPVVVRIFLGHGRSQQYRDLKNHLADHHGLDVEGFESGSRAGHTVRDILDSMARKSTIALLLLTAEDQQADQQTRARQNVVHELGPRTPELRDGSPRPGTSSARDRAGMVTTLGAGRHPPAPAATGQA